MLSEFYNIWKVLVILFYLLFLGKNIDRIYKLIGFFSIIYRDLKIFKCY